MSGQWRAPHLAVLRLPVDQNGTPPPMDAQSIPAEYHLPHLDTTHVRAAPPLEPPQTPPPDEHPKDDAPPRKSLLGRVLTRDIPKPPFAGRKLGRSEVEQILAVADDTGRQKGIDLRGVDLREADLSRLNLAGVRFGDDDPIASDGERRDLAAQLDRVQLVGANLEGAVAPGVSFEGANLQAARLTRANLRGVNFARAYLVEANLREAQLTDANFAEAKLMATHLEGAVLVGAQLKHANLRGAYLSGADLGLANLSNANLCYAYCDEQTHLGGAYLRNVRVEGWHLRDVDLTAVDWSPVRKLGEEQEAATVLPGARAAAYRLAARVYRRLGLALRGQGMVADGNRFLARARHMEARALWAEVSESWRGRRYLPTALGFARWFSAATQGAVTGYGEQPIRALGWGAGIVVVFALLFSITATSPMSLSTALLVSGGALLGHGYTQLATFVAAPSLTSLLTIVEATCGTVLELLFILALARKTQA